MSLGTGAFTEDLKKNEPKALPKTNKTALPMILSKKTALKLRVLTPKKQF
jgi:hypothetical protein